jgi:hypothetical protein
VNKVKAALLPAATDTVPDALQALGIHLPAEILAEVAQRNRSVHQFLMNRRGTERDLLGDSERLRKIRCALLAVYAKLIGYAGPISGCDRDSLGHAVPAAWWPHGDGDATRWFGYARENPSL